ncbi:glycine betaine ABC transporter substrate-binding protein [Bacillus sp. 03113]|uniref:glycine betaine ABC transporter substrate-binding protein n=1 Tax=Bacillus sp. 03113 TaxID=2578211 RepID=UPI0011423C23|nr:glycine betaine ABC transporter substrate-binding protein [Bacillus sp. 03113]
MFKKIIGMTAASVFALGLTACSSGEDQSNKPLGEQVDHQIVGIDPGAGLMKITTEKVLPEYNLDKWEVVEGSGAAMTAALAKAYKKKEPIIITGWSPHWMFSKFDLKYLEDPKGVYGGEEDVHTIARLGLKENKPSAYQTLDQFNWKPADIEDVMLLIDDGKDPEEAAEQWIKEHKDVVSKWTEGVDSVNKEKLKLLYVAWDDVIASTNVIGKVLESIGYDVELVQVDAGPMWAGISDGSGDAIVGAWLPTTHADYYAKYKGKFEDLGSNLHGTKLGLVVPSYMEIDSIEDLKK